MQGLVLIRSEADCAAWARRWGLALEQWIRVRGWGWRIFLEGDLGAGKTFFVRHLLGGLGVRERVKSPSFSLLNSYPLACGVMAHHFDFYRLADPRDWLACGLEPCFEGPDVVLAEWPQRAWLPAPDWHLQWQSDDHAGQAAADPPGNSADHPESGADHPGSGTDPPGKNAKPPALGPTTRRVRVRAGPRFTDDELHTLHDLLLAQDDAGADACRNAVP